MIKLYVDTSSKQLVDSPKTLRLPPVLPSFVQGDKYLVQLHFLEQSGRNGTPYDYVDFSGKTVKLALADGDTIVGYTTDWTPSAEVSIGVEELSGTTVRVRPSLAAIGGSFEITFESAGPVYKRTGAIPFDISAEDLASLLNDLDLSGTVTVFSGNGYWDITISGGHAAYTITADSAGLICERYMTGALDLNTEEAEAALNGAASKNDCYIEIEVSDVEVETVQHQNVTLLNDAIGGATPDPVVLDSYYTKTEVDNHLDGKVDVEEGKGLSENDFTDADKAKLDSLEPTDVSALEAHAASTANPHAVTKAQVGLSNVDNTSDADKPISTATATALAGKASAAHGHDASDITSGTIDIARLPAAALERIVASVADEAARYALTTATAQEGDMVKQIDNGFVYALVDEDEIDNSAGWVSISVGSAGSVAWSGVTDKPTVFPPDDHTHAIEDVTGLQDALDDKVDAVAGKGLSEEDYTSAEKTKLAGVAAGATANDTDANLLNRANHTGTQAISTVTGLQDELDSKLEDPALVTEATTARTLGLTDAGKYIRFTNGAATTLTIPLNATVAFAVGAQIELFQAGAGQVTIAKADGAITVNSKGGNLKLTGQFSGAHLRKVDTNTWDLVGDLAA